jgi:hypothetical protein
MAGSIVSTNILQTMVSMGLRVLRENCLMPRVVNRDYESMITGSNPGATVNVMIPAAVATRAVVPDVVSPAVTAVTPTTKSITLDQWDEAVIAVSDKVFEQVKAGMVPKQLEEAAKSLANTIDTFIWGVAYKGVYSVTGTDGSTPFANDFSDFLNARKLLNDTLCPPGDRSCFIDPSAEANVLGLTGAQSAAYRGSTEGIREAEIGRMLGADWASTTQVPTHTTTGTGTIVINDASVSVGDTSLTWDGGGTEPVKGDVFVVAGDSQQYVVDSATATTITMFPAAKVAWADNAALTFRGTYTANLLFHRDLVAYAQAPFTEAGGESADIATAIDEESGLSLRIERTRQNKQWQYSYDCLYGASVIRPELGCVIAG